MRSWIRPVIATGAGVVAVAYLAIGSGIVTVVDGQQAAPATPMFLAAALFVALAVGTLRPGGRRVAVAGMLLQLLVLVGYVVIAPERTPSFEVWGISLKTLQFGLLVGFASLARATAGAPVADRRQEGPG